MAYSPHCYRSSYSTGILNAKWPAKNLKSWFASLAPACTKTCKKLDKQQQGRTLPGSPEVLDAPCSAEIEKEKKQCSCLLASWLVCLQSTGLGLLSLACGNTRAVCQHLHPSEPNPINMITGVIQIMGEPSHLWSSLNKPVVLKQPIKSRLFGDAGRNLISWYTSRYPYHGNFN